ncbi:3-hydroxyacyl-ACP dehydratase FabZ [Prevotella sp. tf2-5]|uniref:3-hydroxyacyl-ACP dehydratase FabZ n=1 Tax=Prevotella sp. tf2-5 TaxID=1761889 RepID=UPI0008F219B0|nr:3-hydroxyacyl-ACP dehydratase FabZ [Prevotella sp. tf2-5]SFP02643.1 3-hydroxyacyl-[acyl-carrier-protein] dehydratase [Prevotella sp. tf2-5]
MDELVLDYNDILRVQVNRNPYLMIDKATKVIPGKLACGYKNLSFNEWFFPVHFPGNPCMPGFLQAEALTQMCALTIFTLEGNEGKIALLLSCEKLRLFNMVRPGDKLDLETELISYRHGIAKGKGRATVDGKLVCSCEMTFTLSDSEERKSLTPKV